MATDTSAEATDPDDAGPDIGITDVQAVWLAADGTDERTQAESEGGARA